MVVQSYLQQHLPESTERIRQAIVAQLEPVFGRPLTVNHLQSFTGLSELAASIIATMEPETPHEATTTTKTTTTKTPLVEIPLLVQDAHGSRMTSLTWKNPIHNSLLQALKDDPMTEHLLEASCGGNSSCSSCHVLLETNTADADPTNYNKNHNKNHQLPSLFTLPPPAAPLSSNQPPYIVSLTPIQEAEQDMLDYAAEYDKSKSRLACQVHVMIRSTTMDDTTVATNTDRDVTTTTTTATTTTSKIITTTPITIQIPKTVNDLWK